MPLSLRRRTLFRAAVITATALVAAPIIAVPATAQETLTEVRPLSRIAAGTAHTIWLAPDGRVAATGSNTQGQLGDGTTTNRLQSVWVQNLTDVVAVSAGTTHSLALDAAGRVWAWGGNGLGQLGDGTTTNRSAPVRVLNLNGIVSISAGHAHNLAIDASGRLWAWGLGLQGQLGDGTTTSRTVPVQVASLTGVVAASAGEVHSLAVDDTGAAWAWGFNSFGYLGNGTTTGSAVPVRVNDTQLNNVVAVAAGGNAGEGHSLAVDANGAVWAWGANFSGQLGLGVTVATTLVPARINPNQLSGVVAIAAGGWHSLAIRADGTAWAWGANQQGQLGDGTTTSRFLPVPVDATSMLSAGDVGTGSAAFHSLAIEDFGPGSWAPWAWGVNSSGQLGTGSTRTFLEPVPMNIPVG